MWCVRPSKCRLLSTLSFTEKILFEDYPHSSNYTTQPHNQKVLIKYLGRFLRGTINKEDQMSPLSPNQPENESHIKCYDQIKKP